MKVKDLVKKAHLYKGQSITVRDATTCTTYRSKDRYSFEHESTEKETIWDLRVNSFEVNADGLTIWAQ